MPQVAMAKERWKKSAHLQRRKKRGSFCFAGQDNTGFPTDSQSLRRLLSQARGEVVYVCVCESVEVEKGTSAESEEVAARATPAPSGKRKRPSWAKCRRPLCLSWCPHVAENRRRPCVNLWRTDTWLSGAFQPAAGAGIQASVLGFWGLSRSCADSFRLGEPFLDGHRSRDGAAPSPSQSCSPRSLLFVLAHSALFCAAPGAW